MMMTLVYLPLELKRREKRKQETEKNILPHIDVCVEASGGKID